MERIFQYAMPTIVYGGALTQYADAFKCGEKALIVTGRSSAKNGALDDVQQILEGQGIAACVFDRVEENPSIENVEEAARMGRAFGADFVIGIGGGSPLDAAKAVMLLIANPGQNGEAMMNAAPMPNRLPVLAIPTTAGTGSEVTPFAILTVHAKRTKASIPQIVFPEKAFLAPKYMSHLPVQTTINTAVDALAHLVEGYLSSRANPLSDQMAESGLTAFGALMQHLAARSFDEDVRGRLLVTATIGGLVITQTKTSLPHQMGYALTYEKQIPHGAACGVLLAAFMRFHRQKEKTDRVCSLLGLPDIDALKTFLSSVLDVRVDVSTAEIENYARALCANPERLKAHPYPVTLVDLQHIYECSLLH